MIFISKRKAIKELEKHKTTFHIHQKHCEDFVKELEERLKNEPDNKRLKTLYEEEKTSVWHWKNMVMYVDELIKLVQRA